MTQIHESHWLWLCSRCEGPIFEQKPANSGGITDAGGSRKKWQLEVPPCAGVVKTIADVTERRLSWRNSDTADVPGNQIAGSVAREPDENEKQMTPEANKKPLGKFA